MKTITVFTPTYNRAYILPQLYESLKRQTSQDFCWLIVDDGSTDNTKEIVDGWIQEAIVDIHYYYQENGGKIRAHNFGVTKTESELFLCCDSDDYFLDDAIEIIMVRWHDYVKSKEKLSGLIGPRSVKKNGKKIENIIPDTTAPLTYQEFTSVLGKIKEAFLVFRTDVIRVYPFPVQDGEKYFPEGFVYRQIDKCFKMLPIAQELICGSYLDDGISQNAIKTFVQNSKGYALVRNDDIRHLSISSRYLKSVIDYIAASLFSHRNMMEIIKFSNSKLMTLLLMPLGYVRLLLLKRKYDKIMLLSSNK